MHWTYWLGLALTLLGSAGGGAIFGKYLEGRNALALQKSPERVQELLENVRGATLIELRELLQNERKQVQDERKAFYDERAEHGKTQERLDRAELDLFKMRASFELAQHTIKDLTTQVQELRAMVLKNYVAQPTPAPEY